MHRELGQTPYELWEIFLKLLQQYFYRPYILYDAQPIVLKALKVN